MGASLAGVGLLVCLATLLVAVLDVHTVALTVVVVLALLLVAGTGWALTRSTWVVRLDEDGYQVRHVRGVGVARAGWREVDSALTATIAGDPCLVLRLRDGRTSTIPLRMLEVDPDEFAKDVADHLQRGHGLRRLS